MHQVDVNLYLIRSFVCHAAKGEAVLSLPLDIITSLNFISTCGVVSGLLC
jgi:hypothetical protein